MPTELADDATHTDIEAYVDEVVKEVEVDRAGEKGDAQRIAEENDEPVTAEASTGSDDTAETGEESPAQDWLDDELKAEVAAYGIDDEELAGFTSREELDRALRFLDRSALEAGRKAMAEKEPPAKERDDQGRFVKSEPQDGRYEIGLSKDVYDDGLVDELTRMRDHYESRLSALEGRLMEADTKAEEQRFDGIVDSLGHADLFGTSGKENAKQLQRRQDLFVAVKAQQIGLQALGREADLGQSLVSRVAHMVFAEDLTKKELKSRTRRVSQQSNSRLGGSAVRAHDAKEPLMEEMERLYKELEGA